MTRCTHKHHTYGINDKRKGSDFRMEHFIKIALQLTTVYVHKFQFYQILRNAIIEGAQHNKLEENPCFMPSVRWQYLRLFSTPQGYFQRHTALTNKLP